MNNLSAVAAMVIVIACFGLLSRFTRDPRPRTKKGKVELWCFKILVFVMLVSVMGYLLYPHHSTMWVTFLICDVAAGLVAFYMSYYRDYTDIALVGRKLLKIPETHYAEVSEGCRAKLYNRDNRAVFPFEEKMIALIEELDPPTEAKIIFHVTGPNHGYGDHSKKHDEAVRLIYGEVKLNDADRLGPGEWRIIEAGYEHHYYAITHALGVSVEYPINTKPILPASSTNHPV